MIELTVKLTDEQLAETGWTSWTPSPNWTRWARHSGQQEGGLRVPCRDPRRPPRRLMIRLSWLERRSFGGDAHPPLWSESDVCSA